MLACFVKFQSLCYQITVHSISFLEMLWITGELLLCTLIIVLLIIYLMAPNNISIAYCSFYMIFYFWICFKFANDSFPSISGKCSSGSRNQTWKNHFIQISGVFIIHGSNESIKSKKPSLCILQLLRSFLDFFFLLLFFLNCLSQLMTNVH